MFETSATALCGTTGMCKNKYIYIYDISIYIYMYMWYVYIFKLEYISIYKNMK